MVHRCTRKGTVSRSCKEQMGPLGRKVKGKGALAVSPKCGGTILRVPFPPGWESGSAGCSAWSLVAPRPSPGPLSCPHSTCTSPPSPVPVMSSNFRDLGPPHLHPTALGHATFSRAKTKPWPLLWPPPLQTLPQVYPHIAAGALFLTRPPCYSPAQNSPRSPHQLWQGQQAFSEKDSE